jgi:hypothetical protein
MKTLKNGPQKLLMQMLCVRYWLLKVQRVLALCEFHYCEFHYYGFSKKSINLPYANLCLMLWAILFHECDFFGYFCPIWLMRILANANFFQNQKSDQARTLCAINCKIFSYQKFAWTASELFKKSD